MKIGQYDYQQLPDVKGFFTYHVSDIFTCDSSISREGKSKADHQTTGKAIALTHTIGCCQQGESLQQPHLEL